MATKTISLKLEAYRKLKAARRYAGESFSAVVMRATWSEDTVTGRGLVEHHRSGAPFFRDDELDRIEALKASDRPPEDKWAGR